MIDFICPLLAGLSIGALAVHCRAKPVMPVMVKEILPIPLTDYDPHKFAEDIAQGSKLLQVSDSLAGRIQFADGQEKWAWRAAGRIWTMDADKIPNMKDYR